MPYFSGQGKLLVATVNAGGLLTSGFRHVGNVPELYIEMETDVLEHKESQSGQRLTDVRIVREKNASITARLEDFNAKNLALVLYGDSTGVEAGTASAEVLQPAAPVVGDIIRLNRVDVSAVVITDSTGSPKTLTADTNYRVLSADHGTIEILDLTTGGTFEFPLKAAYSYGAQNIVRMFTTNGPELWLRFEGLNTADSDAPVLVEMYKVRLNPLERLDMISDELTSFNLAGSALADTTKQSDAQLGPFGRILQHAA